MVSIPNLNIELKVVENAQAEATRREARLHEEAVRQDVRLGLSGLPAPKNEYQIMVPENVFEDEPMEEGIEEDAADIAERKRAEAKAREEAELRKRSQVRDHVCL